MALEILDSINLVLKVLRWLIVVLNSIIIVASLYFMISGNDLAGVKLDTKIGVVITIGIVSDVVAILGIIAALWWGTHTKLHLGLILTYTIIAMVIMVIGAFLGAVYVKEPTGADIAFIVITVIIGVLILKASLGFAFAIKKTRMLRRLNVVTG